MPIKVATDLPAKALLEEEGIFSLTTERALSQDIRPLKIAILNLMPNKIETELQFLRLLSQTPLQLEVDFLQMESHTCKNTEKTYLDDFYLTYEDIKDSFYDALIITGAPVETLPFEQVDYWQEFKKVLAWSQTNVTSNLHICWGAQASLYYHYGVDKVQFDKKILGLYENEIKEETYLFRGFSDTFDSPQSRYTGLDLEQLSKAPVKVLSTNSELGPLILSSQDDKNIFVLGHMEYETDSLHKEYVRDNQAGIGTAKPHNYYLSDTADTMKNTWRSEAYLLYHNWINYIYQKTPYRFK